MLLFKTRQIQQVASLLIVRSPSVAPSCVTTQLVGLGADSTYYQYSCSTAGRIVEAVQWLTISTTSTTPITATASKTSTTSTTLTTSSSSSTTVTSSAALSSSTTPVSASTAALSPSPTSSSGTSSHNTAAIAGGTVGGIAVVVLFGVLIGYLRGRKGKQRVQAVREVSQIRTSPNL